MGYGSNEFNVQSPTEVNLRLFPAGGPPGASRCFACLATNVVSIVSANCAGTSSPAV
jgi:hypothetical protein